jgi:hypothetical protein
MIMTFICKLPVIINSLLVETEDKWQRQDLLSFELNFQSNLQQVESLARTAPIFYSQIVGTKRLAIIAGFR